METLTLLKGRLKILVLHPNEFSARYAREGRDAFAVDGIEFTHISATSLSDKHQLSGRIFSAVIGLSYVPEEVRPYIKALIRIHSS